MQRRISLDSDKSDIVMDSLEDGEKIERRKRGGERGCIDNAYAYVRYIYRNNLAISFISRVS